MRPSVLATALLHERGRDRDADATAPQARMEAHVLGSQQQRPVITASSAEQRRAGIDGEAIEG